MRGRAFCDLVQEGTSFETFPCVERDRFVCRRGEEFEWLEEWRGWGRWVEQAFGILGGRVLLVAGPRRCESESREGQNRERGTVETAEKKKD